MPTKRHSSGSVCKGTRQWSEFTWYTLYKCKTLNHRHVWPSLPTSPARPQEQIQVIVAQKRPNSHVGWFLDFPSKVLECLGDRLLIPTERPTDSDELLHCRVPGTISSSKSSMSSDMMKCWGVALPPVKLGSRLRADAREGRPGLLTMVKPVRISICCQRWSLSRRAAVTSPRACLRKMRK